MQGTAMTPNDLNWPDCRNARDLGGLPTHGGGRVRRGALIRSDNLSRLTDAGVAAVRDAGVSRVVDVRSRAECESDPSPFAGEPIHRNLPVARDDDPYDPRETIAQSYVSMLERHPDLFAEAVAAIADAPTGCVVVHCHAGKDRSGNVIALALGAVGVLRKSIVADYAILSERMRSGFAADLALIKDPVERDQLAESFTARPETMLSVIEHLDRHHGGAEDYLRSGGITTAHVTALHQRLL
jgi:protein tyrosine/serine phosphatase